METDRAYSMILVSEGFVPKFCWYKPYTWFEQRVVRWRRREV